MTNITLNFNSNTVLQEDSTVAPIDPNKLHYLRSLVYKHLPRFDNNHPLSFRWDGQTITLSQKAAETCVENNESIKEFLKALAQIAPLETKDLEYGVHGIKNTTGHHCWVASALQLAYNLFPERLDSFLPTYQEVGSSADFAEDFLDHKGNEESDPQEALSRIIDTSIEPVTMTLQELRLSQNRTLRFYDAETICNTLVLSSSESDDFNTLLSSSLKGRCDKETDTYIATEFMIKIPENPPHLSFDLRNCAQVRSLDGHLARREIKNIPLHLDNTHLGVNCSLDLKGAILHFGGSDQAANNHYVALFQKPHPITNIPQWFLANDSLIFRVSLKQVTQLLPRATHLYYEHNPSRRCLDDYLKDPLLVGSADERVHKLKDIVTDLLSLRFEEKAPLSWFELLSDAFHGCDAVSLLDEKMMIESLFSLHQELLPGAKCPSSSTKEELSFLQTKLLRIAQERLKSLKKELSCQQEKMLQTQHQAKKDADTQPNVLQKISAFIHSFFAPTVYYA